VFVKSLIQVAIGHTSRSADHAGTDIVDPVRFSPASGILPWFDRASADLAGLAWSVGGVIFAGRLIALAEVGIRKSPALARDVALLR
jgi:hypothetical protein